MSSRAHTRHVPLDKVVAVGIGLALVALFLWSQRPHPRAVEESLAQADTAVDVAGATAESVEIPVLSEGIGTVRSRRQTEIASRILSEVQEIRVQPGDAVEEGAILVVLDNLEPTARVEEAEATLRSLDESLAQARTEHERTRNLFQKEAATQQALDLATFRLAEAQARREAASKALEQARVQLGHATIRAPFAGLIYRRSVDPGDLAAPGRPVLGLYDPTQLRLEALVEEQHSSTLSVGDRVEVSLDSLGERFDGTVSEIVPAVDPLTRTGTIKVDLPPRGDIRPGFFGRVRVPLRTRTAVVVPSAAVVRRGQLEIVFEITTEADDPTPRARMRLVRFGLPVGEAEERVEVLSGLAAGARVVAAGSRDLRDGSPLRVRPADAKPSAEPTDDPEGAGR